MGTADVVVDDDLLLLLLMFLLLAPRRNPPMKPPLRLPWLLLLWSLPAPTSLLLLSSSPWFEETLRFDENRDNSPRLLLVL